MLAVPRTEVALSQLLRLLSEAGIPRFVIGNGSNLLAPDDGYQGVVIKTTSLCAVSCEKHVLTAECGAMLPTLARLANVSGISGFSLLAGIPATVGGALFMNAGAMNECIGDRVLTVRVVSALGGEPFTIGGGECHFSYRKSLFQKRGLVVLSATFTGPPEAPDRLAEQTATALKRRKMTQPLEYPSAGSLFKRPPGDFAGRLIEAAGLKGYRVGGAEISRKHAGFLVNIGNATAADVRTLTADVRMIVAERFGVLLEREIEYLGEV
jgi:UDP-N-acetylmuramate dehydrogenase